MKKIVDASWRALTFRKKMIAAMCVATVILGAIGYTLSGSSGQDQRALMMSDGLPIFDDGMLSADQISEDQFYQSSYDWRHFMLIHHSEEYRRFVSDTNDGLVLPTDVLGRAILKRFIDAYVEHVDHGLKRISNEDTKALLREHLSILSFAIREHGPSTCLAYAYSQYVGIPPLLRVSYIERKENFRKMFHDVVGRASTDLSPLRETFDIDTSDVPLSLVSAALQPDQVTYLEGGFSLSEVPQAFVCFVEIDRMQALIDSDAPNSDALRRGVLRRIYDPRRGTLDLQQLAAS